MQQHYNIPRLAYLKFKFFESPQAADEIPAIIMVFFGAMFALTLLGLTLYLYVAGALHTFYLRPFRFAVYILMLICAMTLGIGLIQHSQTDPLP